MNIDKKTCINIGIVTFLLYLAIHYWDGLVGLFNLFLAAAGPLYSVPHIGCVATNRPRRACMATTSHNSPLIEPVSITT